MCFSLQPTTFTLSPWAASEEKSTTSRPTSIRFSKQGMRFFKAHVNAAICAPSRAILATGFVRSQLRSDGVYESQTRHSHSE